MHACCICLQIKVTIEWLQTPSITLNHSSSDLTRDGRLTSVDPLVLFSTLALEILPSRFLQEGFLGWDAAKGASGVQTLFTVLTVICTRQTLIHIHALVVICTKAFVTDALPVVLHRVLHRAPSTLVRAEGVNTLRQHTTASVVDRTLIYVHTARSITIGTFPEPRLALATVAVAAECCEGHTVSALEATVVVDTVPSEAATTVVDTTLVHVHAPALRLAECEAIGTRPAMKRSHGVLALSLPARVVHDIAFIDVFTDDTITMKSALTLALDMCVGGGRRTISVGTAPTVQNRTYTNAHSNNTLNSDRFNL